MSSPHNDGGYLAPWDSTSKRRSPKWSILRQKTHPWNESSGSETPGDSVTRALDDEELWVIEGSLSCPPRRRDKRQTNLNPRKQPILVVCLLFVVVCCCLLLCVVVCGCVWLCVCVFVLCVVCCVLCVVCCVLCVVCCVLCFCVLCVMCWLLAVGCWVSGVGCRLSAFGCCLLFVVCCSLFVLCCDLQGRKINFTNSKTLVGWSMSRSTVPRVAFHLPEYRRK